MLSASVPNLKATKLTPSIGTEIRGLQLSELSDVQKDELALLIAERGVVVFRDQNFKDIGTEKQKAFASYFGPLHIHASWSFSFVHLKSNILSSQSAPMSRITSSSTTFTWVLITNIALGSGTIG